MGLVKLLPCYIAGTRVEIDETGPRPSTVVSLDGKEMIPAVTTTATQLRQALRHGEVCQKILNRTSIEERVGVVKLILKEYANYRKEIAWALAKFRGLPVKDSQWMCDLLMVWSEQVDELVASVWGLGGEEYRRVAFRDKILGKVSYKSKGYAALITSSTMDGPPGIAAICHAILSGTHLIIRPSWRDVVVHFMFEILHEHKLDQYCQLVRWQSTSVEAMELNRQLIRNVQQAIVFCSDRTYRELIAGNRDEDREHLARKIHKYGTGLPLVIVTEAADLDQAAEAIFIGARRGNGKFCLSHSPVLVDRKIYPALLKKLVTLSAQLKTGDLLDPATERGQWEADDIKSLKNLLASFGGRVAQGEFQTHSMDVIILDDVPQNSPTLYQEFPGTLLALIPFDKNDEAVALAQKSLSMNQREAWTAVNVFGSPEEYEEFTKSIDSFHFLHAGITSEPRFLLPHQGRYFSFDLTRRQTIVL